MTHHWPGRSKADSDKDAVLVRAYGSGTDTMIDRAKELRAHRALAARGLAAPVMATFENGFLCGFITGEACTANDFHDAKISQAMAIRLGQWHGSLPISVLSSPDDESIPNIWSNARKWMDLLPENAADQKRRNEMLMSELTWSTELLSKTSGLDGKNMVFSHTDLLCGNVIIESETEMNRAQRSVTFIDYEYATAAPAAFDIANVFAEWAGPNGELSWMPSQTQRRNFIRTYVDSFRIHNERPTYEVSSEDAVSVFSRQVDDFRGLPGLYW